MRDSGILCSVSSLSSKYGIGCFSKEAYDFVDFLKAAGQTYWQILPLGPTGYGDSPYQSFSTFAGNPYFISLDDLAEESLLTKEECGAEDFGSTPDSIDYGKIYSGRFSVLKLAFERFRKNPDPLYEEFIKKYTYWLDDYCLFMALKQENSGKSWAEWPEALRKRDPAVLLEKKEKLAEEIEFFRFQQFIFHRQWMKLHEYAGKNGIQIIGDIPIYVAFDSADSWAHPEMFQFDKNNVPLAVAGCPPDAFSADGQLWGNPLYDWEYLKKTGYSWWIRRIAYCFELVDVLRVDHFRGFDEYYTIPYGDKTAVNGKWKKGPGLDLFTTVREKLGDVKIIAEDLGYLTDSVRELVKATGFPGMKVLQFAFDSREESDYLPYNYEKNSIVYTGTHDNETSRGWIEDINDHDRDFARRYINSVFTDYGAFTWDFIRTAQSSVSDTCIVPIQDYLVKGNEARMNHPSTTGTNWKWRLVPGELSPELCESIREMTKLYGRMAQLPPEPEKDDAEEDESVGTEESAAGNAEKNVSICCGGNA